jgi:hypothetical protein
VITLAAATGAEPTRFVDWLTAIGAIATPIVVAVAAYVFARRQSRNEELLRARLDYYKKLVPDLNLVMCYLMFIGTWRDVSPPELIATKRRLDTEFYCAIPLFSEPVREAYEAFGAVCFATFGMWGADARIRSNAYRRRQAWCRSDIAWDSAWDAMFTKREHEAIPAVELLTVKQAHDRVIAALVQDLNINRARSEYTTSLTVMNAHAPRVQQVDGAPN